jgi:hypothetical protein
MVTTPSLSYALTIPAASGPHLRVTYTDTNTANVTLTAGTYYVQNDGASDDLLFEIETQLEALPDITSIILGFNSTDNRIVFASLGSKDIDYITTLTTHLTPFDLGFDTSTTTTVINFSGTPTALATADYRVPSVWIPSTSYDLLDTRTKRDRAIGAFAPSGAGVVDVYTGHTVSQHVLPEVYAVLMREQYASDSGSVGNVPGLNLNDTNAALDGWLRRLAALLNSDVPILRWTPDKDAHTVYRQVRLTETSLYESIESWIESDNEGLQYHDLAFELSEVPS